MTSATVSALSQCQIGTLHRSPEKKIQDLQKIGLEKEARFEQRMREKTRGQIKEKAKIANEEEFKSEERRRDTSEEIKDNP